MKIAILGAGFTGLTAALRLSQKGYEVTVFEKEDIPGGLASGFKGDSWDWFLEKAYHHFFTNDTFVFNLAHEIGQEILIKRPLTAIYYPSSSPLPDSQPITHNFTPSAVEEPPPIFLFDSPLDLLTFPYLNLSQKTRTGLILAFLKLTNDYRSLEKYTAYEWLEKYMGKKAFDVLFKPLFIGKFGKYADKISMAWFWARIKKRTSSLAYPAGGYQSFVNRLIDKIEEYGGKVLLNTPVTKIEKKNNYQLLAPSKRSEGGSIFNSQLDNSQFNSVISTLPSPIFLKLTQHLNLPSNYIKRLTTISHLHALNLILELKQPFFLYPYRSSARPSEGRPYWLNINDPSFPFLALVEHTNFMDKKNYNNHHLLYIGNYLPESHEFFKKSKEELLEIFDPYLKIFNKNYKLYIVNCTLYIGPYAQPIITTNYSQSPPSLETGLPNLLAGNLDNVYPWDRGTNYAIELGEKLAETVILRQSRRI